MATSAVIPQADPATQATPSATPAQPQATPAVPSATPSPSPWAALERLKINDRVEYHNPDDAVKGWNELDKFRQQYSGLVDRMKQYGVTDPDAFWANLDFTLDELSKLKGGQPPAAAATPAPTDAPLTRAEVESMLNKQRQEAQIQANIDSAVNFGRSTLKELMAGAKLPTGDEDLADVQSYIEERIVKASRDAKGDLIQGSPEDRFLNGTDTDRKAIVEAEFKKFMRFHQVPAQAANADYAAQKTAAIAAQPKPTPNTSGPPVNGQRHDEPTRMANIRSILSRGQ